MPGQNRIKSLIDAATQTGLVLFVHAEKTLSVAILQPPPPELIEELYRNADEVVAVLLAAREAQW